MIAACASGVAFRSRPHNRWIMTVCTARMTKMTGVRLRTKSLKVSPTCEPMMMLGGSPISVAVPPMLEAMISANRNG